MDIEAKRKTIAILKVLHEYGHPMGSGLISQQLTNWGIDLRERMVRYYLSLTDQAGWTRNLGRRGRVLTPAGRKELEIGIAIDRVGFVAARVDELTYQMTFNEHQLDGTVILNLSLVAEADFETARREMLAVLGARLGMGRLARFVTAEQRLPGIDVPDGYVGIITVCSITLNGVLLRRGITMSSRFGGLLEVNEHVPVRFSQIINYDASTLDPIEVFIKGHMTSVRTAVHSGTGVVGASFREIPTITLPDFQRVCQRLEEIGLGGVLLVGKPNQPLLDIPVGYGRVGVIVAGGLNPLAAVEEAGITTRNQALHTLCDFSLLHDLAPELQPASQAPSAAS